MNEEVRQLMLKLGEAINESLSDSERLAKAVANIKAAGYNVFLILEATIGFSERDDGESPPADPLNPKSPGPQQTGFTDFDKELLRKLRVDLGDDESKK